MNNFFTDNFRISKINTCILVPKRDGKLIHKNRPNHGLVLLLEGFKIYTFESGDVLNVSPGDIFYLPKFSDYTVNVLEHGDCIAVNFELFEQDRTYKPFLLKSSQAEGIKRHFHLLHEEWQLQKNGYQNACIGNLYHMIYHIQQNIASGYISSNTRKLANDTALYIHKNISDCNLTVQKISDYFGYTPEYLRKVFKSVYQVSPRQYIMEARMKKAKELILSNEFSISEISWMCGYDNESYFSCEFKRLCGCRPSEYNTKET